MIYETLCNLENKFNKVFWRSCELPKWIKIPQCKKTIYVKGKTFKYKVVCDIITHEEHVGGVGMFDGRKNSVVCFRKLRWDK